MLIGGNIGTMHPKISAALDFLRFCDQRENPPACFDGVRSESKELSDRESRAYDAAVELLRKYFSGEVDLDSVYGSRQKPSSGGSDVPIKVG